VLAAVLIEEAHRRRTLCEERGEPLLVGSAFCCHGRLLGTEMVSLVRDRDLRLFARDLEDIGASLRLLQKARLGSARCLARFSGLMRKG
jgi:hypothetical protein